MKVGVVGLGRMGAAIARRLTLGGHSCIVFDIDDALVAEVVADGAQEATDLEKLTESFEDDLRIIWLMVPASAVESVLDELVPHLSPYDIVIDGGNTNWLDDLDRASALGAQGIRLLDVGTSGGVWGLDRGYCLMVGGDTDAVATIVPILDTLSPGIDAAPRTNGRVGDPTPGETGWLHCGSAGSGHFVKMVHNGIEYGMMAALAEGLALLTAASGDVMDRLKGSETESVRAAERFDFRIDSITELWRRGSVIDSWLLDLAARALAEDASLDSYGVRVSDSGEGRWASQTGIDFALPMPVISAALQARFASQDSKDTGDRILSALRHQFGGHEKSLVPDVS